MKAVNEQISGRCTPEFPPGFGPSAMIAAGNPPMAPVVQAAGENEVTTTKDQERTQGIATADGATLWAENAHGKKNNTVGKGAAINVEVVQVSVLGKRSGRSEEGTEEMRLGTMEYCSDQSKKVKGSAKSEGMSKIGKKDEEEAIGLGAASPLVGADGGACQSP